MKSETLLILVVRGNKEISGPVFTLTSLSLVKQLLFPRYSLAFEGRTDTSILLHQQHHRNHISLMLDHVFITLIS